MEEENRRYCSNCGAPLNRGAEVCLNCGKFVGGNTRKEEGSAETETRKKEMEEESRRYCSNCGTPLNRGAEVCLNCGKFVGGNARKEECSALGICALVFGILGGWLGLVLGIIGLATCKEERNRKNCKIGIGFFLGWIVLWIIIIAIAVAG